MASKATAAAKTTPAGHDIPGFSAALIKSLGGTPTNAKIAFLNLWVSHEGNNSGGANGVNNPLNIFVNGKPGNFATQQQGVQATANFLKGSYYNNVTALLKAPKSTGLQLAQAVENSPWDGGFSKTSGHYGATYNPSTGTYSGGSLSKAFASGKAIITTNSDGSITFHNPDGTTVIGRSSGPSIQDTVTGAASSAASSAVNAAEAPVTAAASSVTSALGTAGSDVLYALAVAGGGVLMIVGFILIGADIGLEKFGKTKPAQIGGAVVGGISNQTPGARRERSDSKARTAHVANNRVYRDDARTSAAAHRVRHEQNRAKISGERAKQEAARTKAKTKTYGSVPF